LADFRVVDQQQVDPAQQLQQRVPLPLDPVVHRVARHQTRRVHLVEHLHLELGVDVRQEQPLGAAEALGQARRERGEDAEPRLERVRGVEVVAVGARPAEAVAGRLDQAGQVDAALDQEVQRLDRVVAADDADELHGREHGGRGAEVDCGAAERLGRSAEWRVDAVQGNAADHEHAHGVSSLSMRSGAPSPRSSRPLRRTIWTARVRTRRAERSRSSGTRTASSGLRLGLPAWYQELTMPAVASRNSAIIWGARASAARSTTAGKRPSCLMMSCSAGCVSRPRSAPSAETPAGSMPALRKMLDMRACAYWTL